MATLIKLEQSEKDESPIDDIVEGNVILDKDEQPVNALEPIVVIPTRNTKVLSLEQKINAYECITVEADSPTNSIDFIPLHE